MITAVRAIGHRVNDVARHTTAGRLLIALGRESIDDDISGMAAEMAYRFLFALVPFLLLTVTTLGMVSDAFGLQDVASRLIDQWRPLLPPAVVEIIEDVITRMLEDRSGAFFTLGLLATLWGAAAGVGTLLKGLNRAYDVDRPRPLWRRQALGFVVALALPLIALAALVIEGVGHAAAAAVAAALGIGTPSSSVIDAGRVVLVSLAFFVAMSVVYQRLPNVRLAYREAIPGAILAVCGLLLLNAGFALYLERTAGSVEAYTTFAAAFAFLLWLYLVSLVVLLGAELNALLSGAGRGRWLDDWSATE